MEQLSKEIENTYQLRNKKTVEQLNSFDTIHCLNETYGKKDQKIYFKKASKALVEDYDGNQYIDFSMGAGTTILGHAPEVILKKVKSAMDNGTIYTSPNMIAHNLANKLNKVLYLDDFVFCNSGAESTSRAMRLARSYTGKKKIAVFSGGWHGGHDYALVDDIYDKGTNSEVNPVFKSSGVPQEIMDTMILLPYNDDEAFEIIKRNKGDIAAVFIEPSQGSNPRNDMNDFLLALRKVTKENNILLCFDEIITGFRVSIGGAQEYYNIDIDLATYAKTIGGGFPFGIIAGKSEIMKIIHEKGVFMGGTFSANPISVTASLAVIDYLLENDIYSILDEKILFIKTRVNDYCQENSIPMRISHCGSMFRLIFTDKYVKSRKDRDQHEIDYNIQNLFYKELANCGVLIGSNRINFLSIEHTQKIVEEFVDTIIKTIEKFRGAKLI
jgi:glutamate-1-semialdehyde 2,1-aminomutase